MQNARLSPAGLMHWLAAQSAQNQLCVECGAGTGELSAFLLPRFRRVIATDSSPPAKTRLHVEVHKASADTLPVEDKSVDLLFSMQALHHFDVAQHIGEAVRVLRPGGVFAALSWGEMKLPAQIQRAFSSVFDAISPYWEAHRSWVTSGYKGLSFPGTLIEVPPACMEKNLTLAAFEAELATWSAVQNALNSGDYLPALERLDTPLSENKPFAVQWPIVGCVFRR